MKHTRSAAFVITPLLLFAVPGLVSAQAPELVTISGNPSCGECRIVLEHLVDIGVHEGPGEVNPQAFIWMDQEGRFLVSAPANMGVIQVFDSEGHYLESFGRYGAGPGEYLRPRVFWEEGDTLFISDLAQMRLTRVNRRFDLLSTSRLPTVIESVIRLSDRTFVSASLDAMRHPASFGLPYQHLSADGSLHLGSFGSDTQTIRPGQLRTFRRTLASSRQGGFWGAHSQRYRIERWDTDARVPVRVIEREVPWFEPDEEYEASALEVRPTPFLRAIQEDEAGLLWVLISVADENWEPMPPAQVIDGMMVISDAQRNRLHDTVIELIDPEAGVVLASHRIDELLARRFPGPGIVYSYAEDEVGTPWYRIYRLRLVTAQEEGELR